MGRAGTGSGAAARALGSPESRNQGATSKLMHYSQKHEYMSMFTLRERHRQLVATLDLCAAGGASAKRERGLIEILRSIAELVSYARVQSTGGFYFVSTRATTLDTQRVISRIFSIFSIFIFYFIFFICSTAEGITAQYCVQHRVCISILLYFFDRTLTQERYRQAAIPISPRRSRVQTS